MDTCKTHKHFSLRMNYMCNLCISKQRKPGDSLPEIEQWKVFTFNHHAWKVKHYKGLGTCTSKEYMNQHWIPFNYHIIELVRFVYVLCIIIVSGIVKKLIWLQKPQRQCKLFCFGNFYVSFLHACIYVLLTTGHNRDLCVFMQKNRSKKGSTDEKTTPTPLT